MNDTTEANKSDSPEPIIANVSAQIVIESGRATLAESFLCTANYLMRGVEILVKNPEQAYHACALLAGQTLESVLKSYLAHKGLTAKQLKKKEYGHDLEKLWITSHQNGLKIPQLPSVWCTTLNSLHNDPYCLRYMGERNGFSFPNFLEMEACLKELITKVSSAIKAK